MELDGYDPETNRFLSYLLVENRLKEVYNDTVGTCDAGWFTKDGILVKTY